MKKFFERLRALFFAILTLCCLMLCCIRLMKFQIVNGEEYLKLSRSSTVTTQTIPAVRGEIVDINSNHIVKNEAGFSVIIQKAFFPSDRQEQNNILLKMANILEAAGCSWNDTLPISQTQPYNFLSERERDISKLRTNIGVQVYATAEECLTKMYETYEIAEDLPERDKRVIAGIRYEMAIRSFSMANSYSFAEGVSMDAVVKLREVSPSLPGTDVVEEAVRTYVKGDVLPHSIGTVGPIYAEEYETLRDQGYMITDTVGKTGIEKAMESYLRGTNGTREIKMVNGSVISDEITEAAQPGHTVRLTVDSDFQRSLQMILSNHIHWLNDQTAADAKGTLADAGAIVVLDVKTGAVLGMANYPTFDINDYISNYSMLAADKSNPLFNRATDGLYRPGSTFKTVTATAALNEGIIDPSSTVTCNKVYNYFTDYKPQCMGYHGTINVAAALRDSCNVFFYDVGRRTGIEKMVTYANNLGLGVAPEIETGAQAGRVSSPDVFTRFSLDWTPGAVIQAAIGQGETAVSPLQLATQAMTLANDGVRYRPYLVEGIYSYNMDEPVKLTEPYVACNTEDKTGYTFKAVRDGMILAGEFKEYYGVEYYAGDYVLTDMPYKTAIKTGSPEITKTLSSSAVIGYYPADNPEIAFAIFVEKGEYAKLMIKSILEAYYDDKSVVQYQQTEPIE